MYTNKNTTCIIIHTIYFLERSHVSKPKHIYYFSVGQRPNENYRSTETCSYSVIWSIFLLEMKKYQCLKGNVFFCLSILVLILKKMLLCQSYVKIDKSIAIVNMNNNVDVKILLHAF